MKLKREYDIPFQVQYLIDGILDEKESPDTRYHYLMRLKTIQEAVEETVKVFNNKYKDGKIPDARRV